MHTEEIKTEDRWEIQRAARWDSKGASWKEEPMRGVLGNTYLIDLFLPSLTLFRWKATYHFPFGDSLRSLQADKRSTVK